MGEVVGVVGVEDGPRYTVEPALPLPLELGSGDGSLLRGGLHIVFGRGLGCV